MVSVILTCVYICVIFQCTAMSNSCLPCHCRPDRQYGGYEAICSNLNLTVVPRNLTEETTVLHLDKNAIQWLPNRGFSWMKNLVILDLSRNFIRFIDDDVFYGLRKLQYLNLDYNQILPQCDGSFRPQFLLPLKNLTSLSIVNQHRECHMIVAVYVYIGETFPKSLQSLYIDCWKCVFDRTFVSLTQLSLLSFSSEYEEGRCSISDISQSTFEYFPHLRTLNLSECQTFTIHSNAFLPLKKLQVLDVSIYLVGGNDFDAFINATMPLQNTPIQTLKFKIRNTVEMKENTFMFLSNTSLTELYFDSDLYPLVQPNTLKKLPVTLMNLTFTHFQFDTTEVFDELENHHSINLLDMSGMALSTEYACSLDLFPSQISELICIDCRCANFLGMSTDPGIIPIPVLKKKSIQKIILNKNRIEYIKELDGDIYTLKYIDVSDNNLKGIYLDFFPTNNTLSYLNLAKNKLDEYLETEYRNLFKRLSKLTFLDISENGISILPNDIFQFCRYILTINVSNNHLQSVEVRLIGLNHLETLDLSDNKLHDLALTTRIDIEHLPKASVLLNGNPLVCGCDELDFLKWVQRNPNRIQDLRSLQCRFSSGRYETFENIDKIISDLEILCKSNVLEISISVSVGVCALAVAIGFLGYHNRWKLKYLYYVGRRGYRRRYDVIDDNDNAYSYDAFVSYADEDRRFVIDAMIPELEGKCGLKLCIHHRDFLPGEVIAANIVNAIQNSRKTLIILSPSFLKSNWCEFEYNMARMEGVSRREEIVLVVLYEDVPLKALPNDMAMMLRRNCYIEYNNDIFDDEVFWYNVLESVKIKRPID